MSCRVLHIITGLATGGAEMMLYKLLRAGGPVEPWVVSLMDEGTLGPRIRELGVPLLTLDLRAGRPTPQAMWRLRRHYRAVRPDVVQGWMYHGNLAAVVAVAGNPPRCPVVWNIRQTLYDIMHERRLTRTVIRLNAILSRGARAIVFNSDTSLRQHVALDFCAERCRIIPNGFDTESYRPDAGVRARVRADLDVDDSKVLIGMVARAHPMKDHSTFLRAASRLVERRPQARFVLAGQGVDAENAALVCEVADLGLQPYVRMIGACADPSQLLPALDLLCLSSAWGDAFPNVVGEAMACGVPCVVTDVGDAARIVGETGRVVPPRRPEALASALEDLVAMDEGQRQTLGQAARARVQERFALEDVARQYESLYLELGGHVRD